LSDAPRAREVLFALRSHVRSKKEEPGFSAGRPRSWPTNFRPECGAFYVGPNFGCSGAVPRREAPGPPPARAKATVLDAHPSSLWADPSACFPFLSAFITLSTFAPPEDAARATNGVWPRAACPRTRPSALPARGQLAQAGFVCRSLISIAKAKSAVGGRRVYPDGATPTNSEIAGPSNCER